MRNTYTRLLFVAGVAIVIGVSYLTYRNFQNYIDEVRVVRHAHRVIMEAQRLESSLINAETGQRGFQLTRDSIFLGPYFRAVKELPMQVKRLDSLLATDNKLTKTADSLNILIESQFLLVAQILTNARRSSLYMDKYESMVLVRSKTNMDHIRVAVQKIIDHEEDTINTNTPKEILYRDTAPLALLVYTVVAVSGMGFLFVRILKSIRSQKNQQLVIEERGLLLKDAESLAKMGSWKWYEKTDHMIWSDGLYQIWGYRPHSFEPTWTSFMKGVHPEDRKQVEDFLQELKIKRGSSEVSYRIEANGHVKYLIAAANPREDAETLSLDILGTVIDVTSEKKAERDLLIAERLSMTGKMARTIAHEIRNPLTSLNLALEQLKDEMPKDIESLNVYGSVIERNANRIEQLIDEMLSSSKPRELNLELASVPQIVKETIALAIDRLNLNEVTLETNYDENLPRVLLDKEKIKMAFLNIIVNAIEAMEPGKGKLRVDAKLKDGFVIISITDNGKGISPNDIEKLFDPFFTAKQGGMGLGLTSTKNILNSHNATIDVSSKLNQGSTFSIFFKPPPS